MPSKLTVVCYQSLMHAKTGGATTLIYIIIYVASMPYAIIYISNYSSYQK